MDPMRGYNPREPVPEAGWVSLSPQLRKHLLYEFTHSPYAPTGLGAELDKAKRMYRAAYPGRVTLFVLCEPYPCMRPEIHRWARRLAYLHRTYALEHPITIYLLPADLPRRMPSPGQPVQATNINSGFTYPSRHTIYIYRREEAAKVLLHEMMHNTCYNNDEWPADALRELYRSLSIDTSRCGESFDSCETDLRPNEAVIEALAEYHHIAFLAAELGVPFRDLWSAEVRHARMQARRLLEHARTLPGGRWTEGTHAMSYINLRTALLERIDELLRIRRPYDPRSLMPLLQTTGLGDAPTAQRGYGLRMTRFGDW